MSNRFDDENNIEMDIKTAFASWGKFVFKCFPQEGRLRSFLSEDSLDDSEEKNVDIIIKVDKYFKNFFIIFSYIV